MTNQIPGFRLDVPMTRVEANALVRAIAQGIGKLDSSDQLAVTAVAHRLVSLLDIPKAA